MKPRASLAAAVVLAAGGLAAAQSDALDPAAIARIREEGLKRSQVMAHIGWLSDVYGPRLTGGPGIDQAGDWALRTLAGWGLANPRRETFPFGRGWSLVRFHAHMVSPQVHPLIGFPAAWSSSTPGTVTADVVRAQIESDADFEKYRGALRGRIVLTQPARRVAMLEGPIVLRMTPDDLREAASTTVEAEEPRDRAREAAAAAFRRRVRQFYEAEGVVALFDRGSDSDLAAGGSDLSWQTQRTDGGTVFPAGGSPRAAGAGPPSVTLAVEHYNRMVRILDKGLPVRVELHLETAFHAETTPNGFNILAEIPGTDPQLRDEVVMIGAHFDSVAAGTGATDNATGSAAMMEAMRILAATGVRPRRTIRLALWGGEEQGLLGSRAWVRTHLGDPATKAFTPAHERLSVYFNSDNGTGRIRGIWLQGNLAAGPIFQRWMAPLADLGVTAIGPRSVGSTDHVSFDAAGIPAFQFMVDRLEYNSRTHHSNMDFYDRVQADDMVQHATVAAVFAYQAAMREERMPRK